MLHFALQSGGIDPITDDQGESGVPIFQGFTFDGTAGGAGQTQVLPLFVFNDDANHVYHGPMLSIGGSDPVAQPSWFTLLDNAHVAGITPTQDEIETYGVPGTGALELDDIDQAGGLNPERKFWIICAVPAGIATANLTGLTLKAAAVEEAI